MHTFDFKNQTCIDLTAIEIVGKRIILKPLEEIYSQEIFREFTSEITRYMLPKPAQKIEETIAFITGSIAGMQNNQELVTAITKKKSGEFLGCCGLHARNNAQTPELGIWLKKDAHGQKYGKEAIQIMVFWAVENIYFDYLIYPVDKANTASRKIPEALGGTISSEQKVRTMSGTYLNEVVYQIPSATLNSLLHKSV